MTEAAGTRPDGSSLQVRRRPKAALVGWAVGLAGVAVVVAWVSTHPAELPTSTVRVTASVPVGQPVYLGVFPGREGFDRTLHLSGVKVFAISTVPVTITPHLCRGGSVSVTTDPLAFCSALVGTEGTTMRSGDEIVLEVSGEEPGTVTIDRIRVAYRDGVQWGTQDAGSPALVSLLPR